LADVKALVNERFPDVKKFSGASPEQQDAVLEALSNAKPKVTASRRNRMGAGAQSFFEMFRYHTITGFLIDPDSDRRGNRDGLGWKVIGRDREHTFQPPFGILDKDYPGWQPADAEKK
jgi:hypothetical protein